MTRYYDRYDDRYDRYADHYDHYGGNTKLHVSHLCKRTRTQDVRRLFERYGRVRYVDLKYDYGYVEFSDPRDADVARNQLDGRELDGSRIIVEFAKGTPRGPGGSRDYTGRGPPPDSGRCVTYGIDGHRARDCNACDWKNKCNRCGEKGHIERDCKNSPKNLKRGRSYSRSPSPHRERSRSRNYSRARKSYSRSPSPRRNGCEEMLSRGRDDHGVGREERRARSSSFSPRRSGDYSGPNPHQQQPPPLIVAVSGGGENQQPLQHDHQGYTRGNFQFQQQPNNQSSQTQPVQSSHHQPYSTVSQCGVVAPPTSLQQNWTPLQNKRHLEDGSSPDFKRVKLTVEVDYIPVMRFLDNNPPLEPYKFRVGSTFGSIPKGHQTVKITEVGATVVDGFVESLGGTHDTGKSFGGEFDESDLLVSAESPYSVRIDKVPKYEATWANRVKDYNQLVNSF